MSIVNKPNEEVFGSSIRATMLKDLKVIINKFFNDVWSKEDTLKCVKCASDLNFLTETLIKQFIENEPCKFIIGFSELGATIHEFEFNNENEINWIKWTYNFVMFHKYGKFYLVDCSEKYDGFKEVSGEYVRKKIESNGKYDE